MDDARFDRLVRQWGVAKYGRRGLVRLLTGAALAPFGLEMAPGLGDEADARKKKPNKKKGGRCTPRCSGKACGASDGCRGICRRGACPGTQVCADGACRDACPSPQLLCPDGCVDINTTENCGGCGNICPDHSTCSGQECVCTDGFKRCGARCIANSDCCIDGTSGCAHSRFCCVEGGQGVCRNISNDTANCGGCGDAHACANGQDCINGMCESICAPECPSERPCYEGTCTCRDYRDCELEQNPRGNNCLPAHGSSGPKICGCNVNTSVCEPGEACSECCENGFCQNKFPQTPGYVCAPVPKDSYLPRFCCKPNGEGCAGSFQCCSGNCLPSDSGDSVCFCSAPGESCATDIECCRGACDTTTRTCTCDPPQSAGNPCGCLLPGARCTDDAECCRGECRDGVKTCV